MQINVQAAPKYVLSPFPSILGLEEGKEKREDERQEPITLIQGNLFKFEKKLWRLKRRNVDD